MIKLKQFVAVVAMGLALIIGSEVMAKGSVATTCQKTQWLNGKKCAACPANATCNGQIFKCNKNFAQSGAKCIQTTCTKGQWMNGSKCAACPANATCKDGRTFTCNKNFAQKGNTCIAATCPKGQWMNGSKCAACPANATCDGKVAVCRSGYIRTGKACMKTTSASNFACKPGYVVGYDQKKNRFSGCYKCPAGAKACTANYLAGDFGVSVFVVNVICQNGKKAKWTGNGYVCP